MNFVDFLQLTVAALAHPEDRALYLQGRKTDRFCARSELVPEDTVDIMHTKDFLQRYTPGRLTFTLPSIKLPTSMKEAIHTAQRDIRDSIALTPVICAITALFIELGYRTNYIKKKIGPFSLAVCSTNGRYIGMYDAFSADEMPAKFKARVQDAYTKHGLELSDSDAAELLYTQTENHEKTHLRDKFWLKTRSASLSTTFRQTIRFMLGLTLHDAVRGECLADVSGTIRTIQQRRMGLTEAAAFIEAKTQLRIDTEHFSTVHLTTGALKLLQSRLPKVFEIMKSGEDVDNRLDTLACEIADAGTPPSRKAILDRIRMPREERRQKPDWISVAPA